MKYFLFLSLLIISSCSNEITTRSTVNSDLKLINTWELPEIPSDFVQTGKSEWAALISDNGYWALNGSNDKAELKATPIEIYKVEKVKDAYIVLTYDKETRISTTWQTPSLDMTSKEVLAIDDAADIAYSVANNTLYWITQSRQMMVYDFVTKKSNSYMEGQTISSFYISANGNFLAVQDTDSNISMIDLSMNKVILEKKSEAGSYYNIAGALDDGNLILLHLYVAEKGAKPRKNQVVQYTKESEKILVDAMISWAYAFGDKLVIWGDKEIKLYEL